MASSPPATASTDAESSSLSTEKVRMMIDACSQQNLEIIQRLVQEDRLYSRQQDLETGISPLMAASQAGHVSLVQKLLEEGAPWNALDRQGKCAGNYATDAEQWEVVNMLVDWATRAELILGELQRASGDRGDPHADTATKDNYLQQSLQYNEDGTALMDADKDAVMMEWETPIMKAHAQVLLGDIPPPRPRRVLNVGFGMGIIDSILQDQHQPTQHFIIEAHPDVYKKMVQDGWDHKTGVTICHGRWQDVLPQLIASNVEFDGIFFDTYAEHAMDMQDFHCQMTSILAKPNGIYSFFNGLAPDNLFFHGVACNVIKLQLGKLGLDSEFLTCQIEVKNINNDKVWQGIRRKYWHNRDVYYLPRVTWNQEFLGRKTKAMQGTSDHVESMDTAEEDQSPVKRQRRIE
jgi:protein arginine N-methyltransferase 2